MKKNKRRNENSTSIKTGDFKDVSGTVSIVGRDIITHQSSSGISAAELRKLFDQLYTEIDAHPKASTADKEDIKEDVKEIQATVTEAANTNKEVDESFLSRRFRSIARVAPDILDVVVATIANPLAGLGVAAKKIAEKAKEETKS